MNIEQIERIAEEVGCGSYPSSNGVFHPPLNIVQFVKAISSANNEELAASQSREKVLRGALCEVLDFAGTVAGGAGWWEDVWEANHYEGVQYANDGGDTALKDALAAERERCAKVCDELHNGWKWAEDDDQSGPKDCSIAIRALGDA